MDMVLSLGHTLLPFLIVITTLVFVHEMGHYTVARYYGVHAEVFSIGIGPELFGWTDRHHTRWRFSLLPLGGYVRFLGDADASSRPDAQALKKLSKKERSRTLSSKPPFQRIAISCAGPGANYLLSLALFWGLYTFVGQKYTPPHISGFAAESAAYAAGLRQGDKILSMDDQPIERFEDVSFFLKQRHTPSPIQITVDRPSEGHLSLQVSPQVREIQDVFGDTHRTLFLGISGGEVTYQPIGFGTAFIKAAEDLWILSWGILKGFWEMMIGVRSTDEVGGPIRIAQMSSKVFNLDHLAPFIWFMGMLSLTLGLINLLPIPMLDGGHVVLYLCEAIKGKPLSEKVQEYAFRIGFGIVGSLMILAIWNDLQKLAWVQGLKSWAQRLWS